MWIYEKRLQYPVRIARPDAKLAKAIISQYGGPNGEAGASMRYLSQRYTMPWGPVTGILTDVGTEEMAHQEIICSIVYQLTRDLTASQLEEAGMMPYYIDHTAGIYPVNSSGVPFDASTFQSVGDPIADLNEDLAADGTTA